jgi:hypothetical protein
MDEPCTEQPPADTPRRNSREGGSAAAAAAVLCLGLVLLPMFYVLSLGPAVWLANREIVAREPLQVVYAPLIWLHENAPLEAPLDWYVDLWE